MADHKAPITCHILDTSLGRPAANVRVRLELTPSTTTTTTTSSSSSAPSPSSHHPTSLPIVFESTTNSDGRVTAWLPYSSPHAAGEVPVYTLEDVLGDIQGASRWTLRFDTEGYFGATKTETFFPEVVVVFEVKAGERYHVPLLLAPYGYSTYRGS
ncbi:unnamed protein product [Discula destructiva]